MGLIFSKFESVSLQLEKIRIKENGGIIEPQQLFNNL